MDVHDRKTRSYNMSRIRGHGTKPELRVLEACKGLGRRYLKNRIDLPGKPDVVFPRGKVALFVHGCFWHSHDCPKGQKKPMNNAQFWREKRLKTVERDVRQQKQLEQLGYSVHVIWECETASKTELAKKIEAMLSLTDG